MGSTETKRDCHNKIDIVQFVSIHTVVLFVESKTHDTSDERHVVLVEMSLEEM